MARLELGAQIPAWHWDYEVAQLRDWAQAAEAIGYDFLFVADHVMYPYARPGRATPRSHGAIPHHEALTLLAAVAVWTARVSLMTSVLVLPQRGPVLVAKQAAEVDWLSGGRLRLGVGAGWLETEFGALGASFGDRGARLEEAVALLRACWRQEPVSFAGRFDQVLEMSLLPKPVTPGGPPIIFGGGSPRAMRRAARLGDGWVGPPNLPPGEAASLAESMRGLLREAGREEEAFPLQESAPLGAEPGPIGERLGAYRAAGYARLGVHLPSFDRAAQIPMDAYLRRLEMVQREVWPGVLG